MGILGGDWVADRDPNTLDLLGSNLREFRYAEVIDGQGEFEMHTDIDVAFAMSVLSDTGLTFGASIDLDESDGDDGEGSSAAFDNRKQGGEEVFISGAFGTLTMGDTDGALDWALQDIGIGGSLGDAHTTHLGYMGNDFADGGEDGDGQIARYDHSFGDFAVALSADIAEAGGKDILAAGARYNASFSAMELGLGVGYQQRASDGEENEAFGVSLDANFNNGFRAILNWVDMGAPLGPEGNLDFGINDAEEFMGLGLAYTMGDWVFAANYGLVVEREPFDRGQEGYGIAVNYDLGGGAEMQLGYSNSSCRKFTVDANGNILSGGALTEDATIKCRSGIVDNDYSAISFGVAMNF